VRLKAQVSPYFTKTTVMRAHVPFSEIIEQGLKLLGDETVPD
jgi:hypothetical protein